MWNNIQNLFKCFVYKLGPTKRDFPNICENFYVYNGHPGLITDFPELKGKDPQVRAYEGIKEGKYQYAGAVLHKVTAGVDEGRIILQERFNTFNLDLDGLFRTLRDRSLYMWCKFLRRNLWLQE